MGWRQVSCWVLVCDRCHDGWLDDAGLPHFDSKDDAVEHARAAGWVVSANRMLCPQCAFCDVCSIGGHHWSRWTPAGPFPSACHGTWQGRVRHCTACHAAEWDPPVRDRMENLDGAG